MSSPNIQNSFAIDWSYSVFSHISLCLLSHVFFPIQDVTINLFIHYFLFLFDINLRLSSDKCDKSPDLYCLSSWTTTYKHNKLDFSSYKFYEYRDPSIVILIRIYLIVSLINIEVNSIFIELIS